jgi:hypothetical protein
VQGDASFIAGHGDSAFALIVLVFETEASAELVLRF